MLDPSFAARPTGAFLGKILFPLRACLDTTAPFLSPIQIVFSLPLQNGEKGIFTAATVTQRNGPILPNGPLAVGLFNSSSLGLVSCFSLALFSLPTEIPR